MSQEILESKLDALEKDVKKIEAAQEKMMQELSKYKGFFGGIMLAASAVGACFTLVLTYLKTRGH